MFFSEKQIGKLIYTMCVCVSCLVVSDSLLPHGLKPARLLCPWDFPGKDTGMCCHFLLQGIFPVQGSNPGLLHCRQMLYCLSHQGFLGFIPNIAWVVDILYFYLLDLANKTQRTLDCWQNDSEPENLLKAICLN